MIAFAHLQPIVALLAGVLILVIPRLLSFIVAAYLIITGLIVRCPLYKMADVDTSIQEQPYSTTDDRAGL